MDERHIFNRLNIVYNELTNAREIINACKNNKIVDTKELHSAFEKSEFASYYLGKLLYDIDAQENYNPSEIDDIDLTALTVAEKKELSNYIRKFCNGIDVKYTFEKYGDGYRAVLPYLINRRASKVGKYYLPKKKFINNVFEGLLISNKEIIKRFSAASIIIVSHSPYGNQVIRDNDNADSRDVINLINKYLLSTDDNGALTNIVYTTKESIYYMTEIFVVPYHDFVRDFAILSNT